MTSTNDFLIRFWGVRGSVACPGPQTLRYGGNTPCVEVRCGERLLILDAGTGLRTFGNQLNGQLPVSAEIFLSHAHFDHIEGFPFFGPAYKPGNTFKIWAGDCDNGIQAIFHTFMQEPFFPTTLYAMSANLSFSDFAAGQTLSPAPDITVRTAPLNHPKNATGYRIEYQGKSVCYVSDTEHRDDGPDQAIFDLILGSDIMIYDAMYTDEEFATHRGWGHSTWREGVKLCELAKVKTFVAFHHSPDHDDDFLDQMATELSQSRPGSVIAKEGMTLFP